jgi:membrane fusion protein
MSANVATAAPADLEAPFLDTEPPHWAARGLAYLLMALFFIVVIASIFVRLPETVTSPFLLVPVRGTDAVKALRGGVVVEARVSEGQPVARGATIFVIRSQEVGDRFSELATLENQLKNGVESLANARRKRESERRTDEEEGRRLQAHLENLKRMLVLRREQLAVAKEQLARSKKLVDQGLTSWVEYSNYEMKANQTAMDLQQMDVDQRDTLAAIEKLRHESEARETEFRELERSLKETEQKSRIRIRSLSEDPADARGNNLFVAAPCDGTVLRLLTRRPGAVVREGDVLGEVACSGERLQAELTVPQAGLAQIRSGQPVKLLYTAFPYQRYGVHHGTVRWTSPAGVMVNDVPSFRVFVELQEDSVKVGGQSRPLMAGMGGNARVVVGSRSVISYAFEPLRQLRENLAGAPMPKSPAGNSR